MTTEHTNSRREFLTTSGITAGAAALLATLGGAANAHELELNAMGPRPDQLQQFMQLPSGPVVMLNLLKFKPDGGAEEYQQYGNKVEPILHSIGAEVIFSGHCKMTMIGGATWDFVGMVRYPDKTALMQMTQSPEFQAIRHHRGAGLEGQMNLAVFEGRDFV